MNNNEMKLFWFTSNIFFPLGICDFFAGLRKPPLGTFFGCFLKKEALVMIYEVFYKALEAQTFSQKVRIFWRKCRVELSKASIFYLDLFEKLHQHSFFGTPDTYH